MKTVFDESTRKELATRIRSLQDSSKPEWGKMTLYQMLLHCIKCEEFYQGKISEKRSFIGRIFGRMALKSLLNDGQTFRKNSPTGASFKITDTTGDLEVAKEKWIELINEYAGYEPDLFMHWFFGKMTKEQVGYFVYKHADHHLRQFGVPATGNNGS